MALGQFAHPWAEAAGGVELPGGGPLGGQRKAAVCVHVLDPDGIRRRRSAVIFIRDKQVRSYWILTGVCSVPLVNE